MATRAEMVQLAARLRRGGSTWTEIATRLLSCNPSLNGRSAHRLAHGWSQQKVADEWCRQWPDEPITDKHVSWWECWPVSGHAPSLGTLGRLAEIYQCDLSDLVADLACYRSSDEARTVDDGGAEVKRRNFIGGVAAVAAASTVSPTAITDAGGRRLGATDIARLRDVVRSLERAEAQNGGAAVYREAVTQVTQAQRLLHSSTFSAPVGRDLQVVTGDLTEMAAWCAFDAGAHSTARQHWTDAILTGRLTDNGPLTAKAMSTMCLLSFRQDNPREGLALAEAAQRNAQPFGTPHLLSVLASYEALAHAMLGDTGRCHAALLRSEQLLDEEHDDDPEWLGFWVPANFWSCSASCHLALGAPGRAADASLRAVAATDHLYPRNRALYLTKLARSLAALDEVDEAAATARQALASSRAMGSERIRRDLREVADELAPRSTHPAVEGYVADLATALASA